MTDSRIKINNNGGNGGGNMDPESNDIVLTQIDRAIIVLQSDVKNIKEIFIGFKQETNQNFIGFKQEINQNFIEFKKEINQNFVNFKQEINQKIDKLELKITGLYKWMIGLFIGGFIAIIIGLGAYSDNQERQFDKYLDVKFQVIEQKFDSIEQKFDSVEQRLNSIEQKFDSIEQRLNSIEQKYDNLDAKIDAQNKDINAFMQANERSYNLIIEALKKASE